jgi:allantoate deiminase
VSEPALSIDEQRLATRLGELGNIGRDEEGRLFRPVYSPQWAEARDLIQRWMDSAGLSTRTDAAGNLFGRLDGDTVGPVVLTGSHIDTVRDGGNYDGALGVLGALAAVEAIQDQLGRPPQPIEIVAFCEEEASRFTSSFWGSRALCGLIEATEAERLVDESAVTLAEAMRDVGLSHDRVGEAFRDDVAAFVELHIEQGRILEDAGDQLGIVRSITGLRQLGITLLGRADHAGTTPMILRRDALAGAAEAMSRIEALAMEMGPPAVATVGTIVAEPGSTNVVPGRVRFTIDVRHPNADAGHRLAGDVESVLREVAQSRGLELAIGVFNDHAPTPLSDLVANVIAKAARYEGVSTREMVSGGGHDSQIMSRITPTAMIFVPSRDGISHSPDEFTPIDQIAPCVQVLGRTMWLLASEDSVQRRQREPQVAR